MNAQPVQHPWLLRLILFLGKPLGLMWIPEDHVQVIYRWTRYAGVRKPNRWGLIRYSGATETLGPRIYTGSRPKEFELKGLVTQDNLLVNLRLYTLIRYDPEAAPATARFLVKLSPEIYPSIAETYYYWVAQRVINQYTATELNRAEVRAQVEEEIDQQVQKEMQPLGIMPAGKPRILGVEIPADLRERYTQIAQRRENILATTAFHPEAMRRALVTEVIESLAKRGPGESLVTFSELLQAYVAEHPTSLQPPTIDHEPPRLEQGSTLPRPKSRLIE
ncbi:MAG: SPFH domain-containing protein [Anaerolineae bacterium]|nr:SPFH domain-containing protein [Anaerolineae bacterium]